MKSLVFTVILIFFTASVSEVRSQGCSDAGVCTVNSMVPGGTHDSLIAGKNVISTGLIFGESQHEVLVFTPYVEYTRSFGSHFSLSGKVNYGFRSGELAGVNGLSDLFLTMGYTFLQHFTFTGGIKVPLSNGNILSGGRPLPMNYQVSLGTTDILLGFGYDLKRFSFMAGYQQPVTQNGNQFLSTDYPEDFPEYKYYSTRNYIRAADVMLRLSYTAVQSERITLLTSILPIYHVKNDTYQEPDGERISWSGSQGLTLNLNVILRYHITQSQNLELNLGAPAMARDVRPDGLSKFAIGIGYNISF